MIICWKAACVFKHRLDLINIKLAFYAKTSDVMKRLHKLCCCINRPKGLRERLLYLHSWGTRWSRWTDAWLWAWINVPRSISTLKKKKTTKLGFTMVHFVKHKASRHNFVFVVQDHFVAKLKTAYNFSCHGSQLCWIIYSFSSTAQ